VEPDILYDAVHSCKAVIGYVSNRQVLQVISLLQ